MSDSDRVYDVVIVGGGPAGLACAIYTARARLSTAVLDKSATAGALAAYAKVANYPGVKGPIQGATLLDTMRQQALEFGAEYHKATVVSSDVTCDPKVLYSAEGTFQGRAVVIATGSMGRSEKIEGEEEFTGRGVGYCATCDAAFYDGKVAAVVGCDEIAIEEAMLVARFARRVHLICPKSAFSAPAELVEEVGAAQNVEIHLATSARAIVGDQFVTGLVIKPRGAHSQTLPVDGVFMLLTGTSPIVDFLGGAVRLTPDGCIDVDCHQATSVPGVYAVGDVTCLHPHQAIIAAAEGVIAALEVDRFLHGRQQAKPDYT
ncbi:MAG: NAD(P)/FAD-dependent oxidoreductase [Armatimonadota bacterium]